MMKSNKHLGKHGHVAIASKDIKRVLFYLEMKGVTVLPEKVKEKDGQLEAIYLNQGISGFPTHLLQK